MIQRLRLLLPLAAGAALLTAVLLWFLAGSRPESPADRAHAAARDAARGGDMQAAAGALQQAILADPGNGVYHGDLGVLTLDRGDAARAIPELQAAAFLAPEYPHVYCR